jgi:hypothetical protein
MSVSQGRLGRGNASTDKNTGSMSKEKEDRAYSDRITIRSRKQYMHSNVG